MTNKIAVITGGSNGIGMETAKLFSSLGHIVYILDVEPLSYHAENINHLYCDVSDYKNVNDVIEIINNKHKHIDILFANAGIHLFSNLEDTTYEEFDKILNVNFKGIFFILKAIIPLMKSNKAGVIVLMGSDQSLIGKSESAIYGATKGAIAQLTKSTAIDCAKFNIRVNCICPGTIDTQLLKNSVKNYCEKHNVVSEDIHKKIKNAQPLGRIGLPIEVAKAVAFLCADDSSFITGSLLSIDGGYVAQ